MKITDAEKEMISKLNHPLYTVEFLEHWVNRNDNPMINAPAALQAMGAKGYLEAVRQMVKTEANNEQRKQIEEMREKIRTEISKAVEGGLVAWTEFADWLAEALYTAGYRKQVENTADVVRCRDCELCAINTVLGTFRCWLFKSIVNPNDFCSYGRRRTECGNDTQMK